MKKITKDLLKIFREEGEFRQGDFVEWEDKSLTIIEITEFHTSEFEGHKVAVFTDPIIRNISILKIKDLKDLTLIEPIVTLSEALLTFIQKKVHWCIIEYSDEEILINCNGSKNIWWQLSKGLFQQEKETQEAIYRILK